MQWYVKLMKIKTQKNFFRAHGHGPIFAERGSNIKFRIEASQISDTQKAFQQLGTVLACEKRLTSKWRRACLSDICHRDMIQYACKMRTAGVDNLLYNEVARKVFQTFVQLNWASFTEAVVSALNIFHHIVNDAINVLTHIWGNYKMYLY